jgi:hypothetical protein
MPGALAPCHPICEQITVPPRSRRASPRPTAAVIDQLPSVRGLQEGLAHQLVGFDVDPGQRHIQHTIERPWPGVRLDDRNGFRIKDGANPAASDSSPESDVVRA